MFMLDLNFYQSEHLLITPNEIGMIRSLLSLLELDDPTSYTNISYLNIAIALSNHESYYISYL